MGNRASILLGKSAAAPAERLKSVSSPDMIDIPEHEMKSNHVDTSTIQCDGLPHYQCDACKRIIQILKYYHEWNEYHISSPTSNTHYEIGMFEYISTTYNLTQLNDDHIHITEHHDDELEALYHYALAQIGMDKGCNILSCSMMKRNHRSRSKASLDNEYRKSLYNGYGTSIEIQCQQTLDKIHSYLLHSFDSLKLTQSEVEMIDNIELKYDNEDNDNETPLSDETLEEYKKIMDGKKCTMRGIGTLRQQSFKFASTFETNDELNEVHIENAIDDDDDTLKQCANTYCFGVRWYYWPHYQDLNELDPINGGLYQHYYIQNAHKDLKDEVTANSRHELSIDCWDDVVSKASSLLKTRKARFTKANVGDLDGNTYYGITHGQSIELHHMIAFLLYANFTELQQELTETFRPNKEEKKQTQSDKYRSWFKRHARYHFWSKYLREGVECFGTDLDEDTDYKRRKTIYFYHGINRVLFFKQTAARFCSPLSVTPELAVAQNFSSATGLILKMGGYEDYLRMFNMSWLSDYTAESERLFIGGYKRLAIESIINVSSAHNYLFYIRAINNLFDLIHGLKHKYPFDNQTRNVFTKLIFHEEALFKQKHSIEIEHSDELSIPQYIKSLFTHCCRNAHHAITLNIDRINSSYARVKWLFMKENDVWCKLDRLCMLFANLKYVKIKNGLALHNKTFKELICFISSAQTRQILSVVPLKEIVIINPREHLLTIEQAKKQFEHEIKQYGWNLVIGSSNITAQHYIKISKMM
eukprot:21828_1